jgi:hypothetical protein
MIEDLRAFEGERVADAEEAVAQMMTEDLQEEDRRIRGELIRVVGSSRMIALPFDLDPEEIRKTIFAEAWKSGYVPGCTGEDLFSSDRDTVLDNVAAGLRIERELLNEAMFADTPGERRLVFAPGGSPQAAADAIRALNLERLRRVLRGTIRLVLRIPARTGGAASYVQLLWGARRLGLMIDASEVGETVFMEIAGPHAFFGRTTMYWNRLFRFTVLVLHHGGSDWRLKVELLTGATGGRKGVVRGLLLGSSLRSWFVSGSPGPPDDFRSGDEEAFQKSFTKNAPHWNLVYEGALVVLEEAGRKRLMVPDFVARSPRSSTEVLIEIVGFWRKDYLERKIGKVRLIMNRRLALIVNSTLSVSREELTAPNAEGVRILFYANREELKQAAKTLAKELEGVSGTV